MTPSGQISVEKNSTFRHDPIGVKYL